MEVVQIIFWLIICALIALLGINRKIGYGWGLFFCLFFSPLVGLIIILCSKKKKVEFIDTEGGVS
jgi:predicted membrane metal-binding protein